MNRDLDGLDGAPTMEAMEVFCVETDNREENQDIGFEAQSVRLRLIQSAHFPLLPYCCWIIFEPLISTLTKSIIIRFELRYSRVLYYHFDTEMELKITLNPCYALSEDPLYSLCIPSITDKATFIRSIQCWNLNTTPPNLQFI